MTKRLVETLETLRRMSPEDREDVKQRVLAHFRAAETKAARDAKKMEDRRSREAFINELSKLLEVIPRERWPEVERRTKLIARRAKLGLKAVNGGGL